MVNKPSRNQKEILNIKHLQISLKSKLQGKNLDEIETHAISLTI